MTIASRLHRILASLRSKLTSLLYWHIQIRILCLAPPGLSMSDIGVGAPGVEECAPDFPGTGFGEAWICQSVV